MFRKMLAREMNVIGVGSLIVVILIALITGAVTTVQTASQFTSEDGVLPAGIFPMEMVGSAVGSSSILELAPLITCLILAGKVGANIASEIGNMKITEQIDAYEVMGVNSIGFVSTPKILAGLIMIPCLILVSAFLHLIGGIIAAKLTGALTVDQFITGMRSSFIPHYLRIMMVKSIIFSFIITSVSSYQGYYTVGGALEVGEAGTTAVVRSCIIILIFDLIVAKTML